MDLKCHHCPISMPREGNLDLKCHYCPISMTNEGKGPQKSFFMFPSGKMLYSSANVKGNMEGSSASEARAGHKTVKLGNPPTGSKGEDYKKLQMKVNKTLKCLTGAELAFIVFPSEDLKFLRINVLGEDEVGYHMVPVESRVLQRAVLENKVIYYHDLDIDLLNQLNSFLEMKVRSFLFIPVMDAMTPSKSRIFVCLVNKLTKGHLMLDRSLVGDTPELANFTESDLMSAQSFLSTSRREITSCLEQEEKRRKGRLLESLMHESAEMIASYEGPEALIRSLVSRARQLLQAARCTFHMVYKWSGQVTSRVVETEAVKEASPPPAPIPPSVCALLLQKGRSINIPDAPSFFAVHPPGDHPAKTLLYVPLIKYSRIVGALEFCNKMDYFCFSSLDESVAKIIAAYFCLWCI